MVSSSKSDNQQHPPKEKEGKVSFDEEPPCVILELDDDQSLDSDHFQQDTKSQTSSTDSLRSAFSNLRPSTRLFFRDSTAYDMLEEGEGIIMDGNLDTEDNAEALDTFVKHLIDKEFPSKDQIPTRGQLINVGSVRANRPLYSPGDWVEIEGPDMIWRVDMITRVIKQAPDDYDWNDPKNEKKEPTWKFTYNAGDKRDIEADDIRSSEEGLKTLFGHRPWVWQQWALVKLEQKLRFQEGHQDDFFELDIQKFAADLWEEWLNHDSNKDFEKLFYDDRIGDFGRGELVRHIQAPFRLMDLMTENNKEWDFKADTNINVFTYLSLLGSGYFVLFLVFAVQLLLPCILVIEVYNTKPCQENNETYARAMAIVVFAYYLFTVIPKTFLNLYNVVGTADSVYSRLNSFRRKLWLQGDDYFDQMIGYKLDIYMNTGYECILSMLNIYVLLKTSEAIDVVLNALAFIFILTIDEEVVDLPYFDPKRRWITAGAVEMVIQTNIKLRYLTSSTLFSQAFDISEEDLLEACDGDSSLLKNKNLTKEDSSNPKYLSKHEQISNRVAEIAIEMGNEGALEEYKKSSVHFGVIKPFCCNSRGVFERFYDFQTWSRWERVLFLPTIPDLDTIFIRDGEDKWSISKDGDLNVKPTEEKPFANFKEDDTPKWVLFFWQILKGLTFWDMSRSLKPSWQAGQYRRFFYRLFDSLLEWMVYWLYIIFPLYLTIAVGDVVYQVVQSGCKSLFDVIAM